MKRIIAALLLLPLLAGCLPAVPADKEMADRREVPILMYHSILRDPARAGKYILSPDVLETDIKWLQSHGYETVTGRDLVAFAAGTGTLPEQPVILTFDDGHLNNLTYVLPILEKYDCCAVISVVGAYTQRYSEEPDPNPNYAYLSWDEVAVLDRSGRVEIGNHTYGLHGQKGRMGSARRPNESAAEYEAVFSDDVGRLQSELSTHADIAPVTFAYPFGIIDPLSRQLLKAMGFAVSMTCAEHVSTVVRGDAESLWELGRYNRPSSISTDAFMTRVFGG